MVCISLEMCPLMGLYVERLVFMVGCWKVVEPSERLLDYCRHSPLGRGACSSHGTLASDHKSQLLREEQYWLSHAICLLASPHNLFHVACAIALPSLEAVRS